MLGRIFTVGGLTLLSRLMGFARDIVLAAVLGAGPIADAFFVAQRLPNHFRTIFGEGAFNAAFVPAYSRIFANRGKDEAGLFANQAFTMLVAFQLVILVLAWMFMPTVVALLAPGLVGDPVRFPLAVELTRITAPFLILITVQTLYSGILNSLSRFFNPAAAPILLNLAMMSTLFSVSYFPTAGHAAAWGVLLAGVAQLLFVGFDIWRARAMPRFCWPSWNDDIKRFFKALGPATVGSAGLQIALFADTIIGSFLATGALSALYYADRLNQLPLGVIGIAASTVLLPEMSRRLATGDDAGARAAQNRAIELIVLLSLPCVIAFLMLPELIMRALFMRGAFTAEDAVSAGQTLAAYSVGLLPFVLMRATVAPFLARGDTATAVKASLSGVAVNIVFKVLLMGSLAQVGLALATAIGTWVNFILVSIFARRKHGARLDAQLARSLIRLAIAGVSLALALALARPPLEGLLAGWGRHKDIAMLAALVAIGGAVYCGVVLALFHRDWLAILRSRRQKAAEASLPPADEI
jgi:putative peptidoglycan lipid II flippase